MIPWREVIDKNLYQTDRLSKLCSTQMCNIIIIVERTNRTRDVQLISAFLTVGKSSQNEAIAAQWKVLLNNRRLIATRIIAAEQRGISHQNLIVCARPVPQLQNRVEAGGWRASRKAYRLRDFVFVREQYVATSGSSSRSNPERWALHCITTYYYCGRQINV